MIPFLSPLLSTLSFTFSPLSSFFVPILPRCLSLFFSLYFSFYLSLSFCFSLFATRRCVWSVVAAARVDSLITLSGPSGPLPSVSPPPSRPLPTAMPPREKGKKVPKIQSPSPQIVFYECLHVPVGPKPPPTLPSSRANVTRHPRSPSATSCRMKETLSLSISPFTSSRGVCMLEKREIAIRDFSMRERSLTISSLTVIIFIIFNI